MWFLYAKFFRSKNILGVQVTVGHPNPGQYDHKSLSWKLLGRFRSVDGWMIRWRFIVQWFMSLRRWDDE